MDRYSLQLRALAVCPYLAVVEDAHTALYVAACFFIVLTAVAAATSLSRNFVPEESRYLFYAIVSGGVSWLAAAVVLDPHLRSDPSMVHLYVLLTAVNGLVFSSSQDFACRHGLRASLSFGASTGLRVAALLLCIGALREMLVAARLFGLTLFEWDGLLLIGSPAGGLLLFALLLAMFNLVHRLRATS